MKDASVSIVMTSPEYRQFIEDLKTRVVSARISAARAGNREMILLYWDIGQRYCGAAADARLGGIGGRNGRGGSPAGVSRNARILPGEMSGECANSTSSTPVRQFSRRLSRELENRAPRQGQPSFLRQVVAESKALLEESESAKFSRQAVRELAADCALGASHSPPRKNQVSARVVFIIFVPRPNSAGRATSCSTRSRPGPTNGPSPTRKRITSPSPCLSISPNRPTRCSRAPTTSNSSASVAR